MQYTLTTAYILLFNFVLAGFCIEALRRTKSGVTRKLICMLAIAFSLWLAGIHLFVLKTLLLPDDISGIAFFAFIVASVGLVGALIFLTPLRDKVLAVKQEYLMLIQGLRVYFGMGFLIEAALGVMPTYFGVIDGFFHITSAFLAMKAGILMNQEPKKKSCLWTANLFGLTDILIVAGGLSFFLLEDIGPHHNVMYAALFAAPIFINLHLASLYKLISSKKEV